MTNLTQHDVNAAELTDVQELLERGRELIRDEDAKRTSSRPALPERPLGWFFDEVTRDEGDDFGRDDGLTLAQRVYNLPLGRRFL